MPSYVFVLGHEPIEGAIDAVLLFNPLLDNPVLHEAFQHTPEEIEAAYYSWHGYPKYPEWRKPSEKQLGDSLHSFYVKMHETMESGKVASVFVPLKGDTAEIGAGKGPIIDEVKKFLLNYPNVKYVYWRSPYRRVECRCTLQKFLDSDKD